MILVEISTFNILKMQFELRSCINFLVGGQSALTS